MELWSASEAEAADRHTIEVLGMPSPVLMERAALCVSAVCARESDALGGAPIMVLVGPGNNGGDGLAIARQLHGRGYPVRALLCAPRHNAAVAAQLELARSHAVELAEQWPSTLEGPVVVVDALLGTGTRGAPRGKVGEAIAWLGRQAREQLRIVAVDLPSGIDVDTGAVPGTAVRAHHTVSFERSKPGLHLTPARAHVGQLTVAEIGLLAPERRGTQTLIDPSEVAEALAGLAEPAHKGQRGHVGVIGGTGGTPGAAILAGSAALRVGAGLVTLAPQLGEEGQAKMRRELVALRPELMLAEAAEAWRIAAASVLVVGPGLLEADEAALARLEREDARPMVWDASALARMRHTSAPPGPRVLTPHPGEAARMLAQAEPDGGWSNAKVQADRKHAATRLAAHTRSVVVLKGAGSVVAEGERVAICASGSAALASAGTGDVLAGAIAGLLARGLDAWSAACVGVHLHGLAGECCPVDGTLAMDVADALVSSLAAARAEQPPRGWPTRVLG